jgi:hypothetical protein
MSNLTDFTSKKLLELNYSILKELHLGREKTIALLKQLKYYKYVDELNDLRVGAFIKWIPIIDPYNIPLNYNGMICNIKITDNGVLISCKNFMNRYYTFKMDECLIFQKLSQEELVVLTALDHIGEDNKNQDDDDDDDDDI